MRTRNRLVALTLLVAIGAAACLTPARALSDDVKNTLANSKYVYISSTRKDGSLGKPAEIWFLYHNGAVYVGTPPTTWRAKRIKKGRAAAKICAGKPDGP